MTHRIRVRDFDGFKATLSEFDLRPKLSRNYVSRMDGHFLGSDHDRRSPRKAVQSTPFLEGLEMVSSATIEAGLRCGCCIDYT